MYEKENGFIDGLMILRHATWGKLINFAHNLDWFDPITTKMEILIWYDICMCWLTDNVCAWNAALMNYI